MPSDHRRALPGRRRWTTLVLVIAVAGVANGAQASTCPAEWTYVTGSTSIGDGSVTTGNGTFHSIPCAGSCTNYGPLNGSVTMTYLVSPTTYTFEGGKSDYLYESNVGSATCWKDEDLCLHCGGSFAFTFYSDEGAIDGHVYKMPGMTFAPNAQVAAVGAYNTTTTAGPNGGHPTGYFAFRRAQPNFWGLSVYREGTNGPGYATWRVGPVGQSFDKLIPKTITSNQMEHVDIVVPENYVQNPPRCGEPPDMTPSPSASGSSSTGPSHQPPMPPCTVGCPVSVTTGNVDLDQTDAVIPGLGLGLRFARSYNSDNITAGRHGVFGPGWTHSYEKRLTFHPAGGIANRVIMLRSGTGQPSYFQDTDGNNAFLASMPFTNESWIEKQSPTVYVRHFRRGGSERYEIPSATTTARLASLTDASGNVTALGYNPANQLTTITDPGGRQLTLTYAVAQLQTLSGPDGLIATFTYIGTGSQAKLHTVAYADGDGDSQPDGSYTFAYHASGGRLWTVTDGSGRILETHLYDGSGRGINAQVSGDVDRYLLDYSQANKTVVTDSLTNQTTYEWVDIWGSKRITKITGPCSGCGGSGGATQEWTYDNRGRVTSHQDGEGNVTSYTYGTDENDPGPNVTSVTAPQPSSQGGELNTATVYTYHPDGRMHTRLAPNGSLTTWTYVAAGPETITESVSAGVSRTTTIAYTPQGKPRLITDPLARQTEMSYTPQGDLDWVRDPLLHQTSFQYDVMGRLEKTILPTTTPANDSPHTSYDTLGRVWQVTNPNGSFWRHWYDGGGRRVMTQDPNGQQTQFVHDAYGRLDKVIDPLDGKTDYEYDLMSNLVSLTDARTQTTSFEYDGHHRVKKVTYPSPVGAPPFEEFTYDAAGRLETRKDRKGVTTTFSYDGQGRLTGKTYSDGSPSVSFVHDANGDIGFMTSATNSADTLTWDYDQAGQLLSEGSTRNASTVSYVYNSAGQRTHLRLNGADVLTYGYALDGELDTITRTPGVLFNFDPDAAHRRQALSFPNGTTTQYGYDLLSRLALVRLTRGATVLSDIAYESNDLGNRTSRTENGTRLEYGYDLLSRLETVDRTLPIPVVRQEEYTYDAVGNRLSALGIPGAWTYSDRNELLSYNGITFGYDLNGNQTSRSGSPARTYVWDVENRLAAARDNAINVASFEYDPLGRRVAKTTSAGLTRFAYDGEDILVEQGPSGTFTYLHGPGIDEPLAREAAGGVRTYYHADGLGSIVKRTDASGNVIASHSYDSFGQTTVAPLSGVAFTSREWDAESGLYYYRARYYDPKIGRFLSEDPLPLQDRPIEELHPYVYVMNNPVNHVDPLGLSASDWLPCVVKINREVIAGYCGNGKNAATDPSCREAHCIANCRISRECAGGAGQAAAASYAKEVWDWTKKKTWDPDSEGYSGGDQAANKKGRICGKSPYTKAWDCGELCKGTR
jgi:RHS repeat-associated protein